MIVIILNNCPPALRGDLTKWLQEVNTGVYVGQVSARVRDELWARVQGNVKSGRATMVFNTNNEQGMDFRVHNTSWEPIDFDGLKLMLRPSPARIQKLSEKRLGFSKAARARKGKQISRRKRKSSASFDSYVVVDLETTGLSFTEDEIIEIGAILVKDKQIEASYSALIKPNKKLPASIQSLTGISNEMLDVEGRVLSEVIPEFLTFVEDLPIVSHNVNFDYGFLRLACQNLNLPLLSNRSIDTLSLARRLLDDVRDFKLQTLVEYFNIETDTKHRSLADCISIHMVYEKLIEIQKGR
ncbi:MAG TPA: type I-E CRISPR-associated endoribonuclease Cas2 [Clostridiales bacterium]|nr:type I-E CRISPR-associated endoribonuclease Cas2 [Clostridiales bacterium]